MVSSLYPVIFILMFYAFIILFLEEFNIYK